MKDKPPQLGRLSIRWSSCSNDMPRDGFASNSASRRRASAISSSSSCRTDGSDPSRCAARTALSVSGKSSASFSISAMVAIGASLVSTASKARTHQKTGRLRQFLEASFSQPEPALVTLEEELAVLAAYLEIQSLRFGGRLKADQTIGPALFNVLVPAFSIHAV